MFSLKIGVCYRIPLSPNYECLNYSVQLFETDPDIVGLTINYYDLLLSQSADDFFLTLNGDQTFLNECLHCLNSFQKVLDSAMLSKLKPYELDKRKTRIEKPLLDTNLVCSLSGEEGVQTTRCMVTAWLRR